jgi:hypothetical protein
MDRMLIFNQFIFISSVNTFNLQALVWPVNHDDIAFDPGLLSIDGCRRHGVAIWMA